MKRPLVHTTQYNPISDRVMFPVRVIPIIIVPEHQHKVVEALSQDKWLVVGTVGECRKWRWHRKQIHAVFVELVAELWFL